MKELKIDIPEGYEIDKENSTFECIKFKELPKTRITWNQKRSAVEIQDKGEHFLISTKPSMITNWYDAVRYYKDNKVWQLPTREHLKLIAEHIDEVNALIKANGGYEIRGWYWTIDEYGEFCAWYVSMSNGHAYHNPKRNPNYVRAIRNLNI